MTAGDVIGVIAALTLFYLFVMLVLLVVTHDELEFEIRRATDLERDAGFIRYKHYQVQQGSVREIQFWRWMSILKLSKELVK
jgi:hypothetical protein